MLLHDLEKQKLIHPPSFLSNNCIYLTIMGSVAYGCNEGNSDLDIYGTTIPPINILFPHTDGYIPSFDHPKSFNQWQQHHIKRADQKVEYDFQIFGLPRYFYLCLENNPNCIDSLYTADDCIIHCSPAGQLIRDKRNLFLHKGCYSKFRGYYRSQKHKLRSQTRIGKRKGVVEQYSYDLKFAYQIFRLACELRQLLTNGDINLRQDRELYKSVRRGEWTLEQIDKWADNEEMSLAKLLDKSSLPDHPRTDEVKVLLLQCLEHHYGSLDKYINLSAITDVAQVKLRRIQDILNE